TDVHVVVDKQPAPAGDDVALLGKVKSLQVRVGVHLLVLGGHEVGGTLADVLRALGHVAVIEQRRRSAEPLAPEELLVCQPAVVPEAHVSLGGGRAESLVWAHVQSLAVQHYASAPMPSKIASSSTAAPSGSCA